MPYEILATSITPALIIYLLDVSGSMSEKLGNKRRIDVVMDALGAMLRQMVFRSTKGSKIAPRYRIAMYAYSDHVYDLLDGIKGVDQIARLGVPELSTMRSTDTARAFAQAEKLLQQELPNLTHCPAPLVCHMTDGEYTGADPEPIVRRIMAMHVPDGNVLVENIFISDQILGESITDPKRWVGVRPSTKLKSNYARKLRAMSSLLPASYRTVMQEFGYEMANDAVMMIPGMTSELVQMGFVMSMATPISPRGGAYDR
ncbi:MAG: vWA domain-containing protein [Anaerolineae bacterium]|nr:vWA domain-containing protein [Anaerolineae bacterium]